MVYILDTNIILLLILNWKFERFFREKYAQPTNDLVISVVAEGEIKALALKRKWGRRKIDQLISILEKFIIYPVKVNAVIDAYAELDAYSQGVLENKKLPNGMSARNMGKNDLWISATALVTDGILVTADKDFDHFNPVYFQRDLIDIDRFR